MLIIFLASYLRQHFFQDGSYLAELLLSKGYKVHGIIRRSSSFNTARIEHLYSNPITHHGDSSFSLHYGDMTDSSCLIKLISTIEPTEVSIVIHTELQIFQASRRQTKMSVCVLRFFCTSVLYVLKI